MTGEKSKARRIIVEGLIGAGKSTLIKLFKRLRGKQYDIHIVEEPLDVKVLDNFYNMQHNAVEIQRYFYKNLSKIYMEPRDRGIEVLDRSVIGNLVFTMTLGMNGSLVFENFGKEISDMENIVLCETVRNRDFVYFLDIDIVESIRRIYKRGREVEMSITLRYIQEIYRAYVFILVYLIHNKIPVVIINAKDSNDQLIRDIEHYAVFDKNNRYSIHKKDEFFINMIQKDLGICFTRLTLMDIFGLLVKDYDEVWSFEVAKDVMTYIRDNFSIKRN